ncbi:hypothetical protein POPTR_001G426850v4 [Populus trichocarpa]|uniref:Uncharacterized protein n=1 Tax=Populus trichocarpa TaxID=3694 RepID=A0ACC0TPG8_POPTR|nr:hypothetical protein POPTR_001G426850v4 [Populus trichocarpa]
MSQSMISPAILIEERIELVRLIKIKLSLFSLCLAVDLFGGFHSVVSYNL